ncbi:MAG: DUF1266 domain-containing protein [Lachnospiraceae bacterium]|nr:DUF1266 domain-containing protein [Lachnospiraceae bacterium]
MQERKKGKYSGDNVLGKGIAALTVTVLLLAGCGDAGSAEEKVDSDAVVESAENADLAEISGAAETSTAEESAGGAEETLSEKEDGASLTEEPTDAEEKKPVTMAELLGESKKTQQEGAELPETILWFNATYAPLTYSNGWDWRLLAGREPTEENKESSRDLLDYSWNVKDRESALETTAKLLKDGHRKKCIDDTKQMEEWGILELGEEEFVEQLLTKELDDEPGRYAVAYLFHRAGIEPEYMAAWDLCRVNQLYADYYFCGYMSYEEAMDASLANSLVLQELYGSWEEMVEAYLLGYRFWQGDPIVDEYGYDSPTQERRHYYEMLQEMEDGPYTLDWNMELKKSW